MVSRAVPRQARAGGDGIEGEIDDDGDAGENPFCKAHDVGRREYWAVAAERAGEHRGGSSRRAGAIELYARVPARDGVVAARCGGDDADGGSSRMAWVV